MKKSIFAIAALAMGMTFAACGNSGKGGDADSTKKDQPAAEQQAQQPAQQESSVEFKEGSEEIFTEELPNSEKLTDAVDKYNEGKEVVDQTVQKAQETVEAVQNKIDEGKQAVENVKQDAENTKKNIVALGNAVKNLGK